MSAASGSTTTPSVAARLDELFKPWNQSQAPGLVVAVAHRGQLLYRRAFGLASVEHAVANSVATRMRIGSTSKQFAALAAMLLAEEGKLDPDAPLRRYLPELDNPPGEPTLRQLMQHSGGVRDPMLPELLRHRGLMPVLPVGYALELTRLFRDANSPPGERMNYTNAGYYLLSLAIERVAGKSLNEVLTERILQPLGMHDTALLPSDMQIEPRLATFHHPVAGGGFRRGIYPTDELLGSGGMVSTADDMLAWMAHLRGARKRVGSAATWEQMLRRPRYNSGARGDYCLGLFRTPYRGVETVQHAGATIGSACQMLTVPEHALDISLMANRGDVPAAALANKIIDIVLEDQGLEPPRWPVLAQDHPALLGRWYAARSRTLLEFVPHRIQADKPEAVAVKTHNELCGLLFDAGAVLRKPGASIETLELPRPPAGEAPQTLECTLDGNAERFARISGEPPSAAQVASYAAGRYRYAEFGIEMELSLRDGRLRLDIVSPYPGNHLELEPFTEEVIGARSSHCDTAQPLPWSVVILERNREGLVAALWMSGARERNVRLPRCDEGVWERE